MKKLNFKLIGAMAFSLLSTASFSQDWLVGGNNLLQMGGNPPILGTMAGNNQPLNLHTNGIQRAIVTTGAPLSSWAGNFGDGLRIIAAGGTNAHLDLFTSNTNGGSETHARFGGSGQVSGR